MTENKCICDECPRRFVCFTQKKVFSEPDYQAMYEAYVEEGLEHEEAVKEVRELIERQRIQPKVDDYKPWHDDWKEEYDTWKYKEQRNIWLDEYYSSDNTEAKEMINKLKKIVTKENKCGKIY